jgi:chorismate mutase
MKSDSFFFNNHKPLIIGGPCSAESREQVLQTANALKASGSVHLFRAGIWKPRTKPGMFEGVGEIGLSWLTEVKHSVGLPVAIEVATPNHVEKALEHEIDVLWLGARTTVNPFAVQDLANALRGINVSILVKNPINPDLNLWIGAVERLQQAGITNIALVHRGFSAYGNQDLRNPPMWQIALDMKRHFPQYPMICDPSHICGNRHALSTIAQKSVDLDFDGLMIEVHPDPDRAWSDAEQQLTPDAFSDLLQKLVWRSAQFKEGQLPESLLNIREQIDHIDDELLMLLAERMKLADRIGLLKKEHQITILQTERWNAMLERMTSQAKRLGLTDEFIKRYFDAVHLESIHHQNQIMNG